MRGFNPVELMKKQHGHQPWYSYLVEDTTMYLNQFEQCFADNYLAATAPWPKNNEPFVGHNIFFQYDSKRVGVLRNSNLI